MGLTFFLDLLADFGKVNGTLAAPGSTAGLRGKAFVKQPCDIKK
jgi:hypothetical protein